MDKIEKHNKIIALNILYISRNTKKISVVYRSEYNNKGKKQVILLMISNGKKQHYLPVTSLTYITSRNVVKSQRRFLLFKLL